MSANRYPPVGCASVFWPLTDWDTLRECGGLQDVTQIFSVGQSPGKCIRHHPHPRRTQPENIAPDFELLVRRSFCIGVHRPHGDYFLRLLIEGCDAVETLRYEARHAVDLINNSDRSSRVAPTQAMRYAQ